MSDQIEGCDYAGVDENSVAPEQSGFRFAIVRAVFTMLFEGKRLAFTDPTHARDRDKWQAAGRRFGGYMILGWDKNGATPEEQAQTFIAAHGPRRPGELPPALDLEADSAQAVGRTPQECLEWAERAYDALVAHYGVVLIYTSARVWIDVFGGLASKMGASPLWVKVPYLSVGKAPTPELYGGGLINDWIPLPWRTSGSPGVWFVQYQGDAHPCAGVGQCDLNRFCPAGLNTYGPRAIWIQRAVGVKVDGAFGPITQAAVRSWQLSRALRPTGTVDLDTFVAMAA